MSRSKGISLGVLAICLILCFQACQGSSDKKKPKLKAIDIHLRVPLEGDFQLVSKNSGVSLELLSPDNFGQRYRLTSLEAAAEISLLEAGLLLQDYQLSFGQTSVWIFASSPEIFTSPPPLLPQSTDELVVYFQAQSSAELGWGLHVWDADQNRDWTTWDRALDWTGNDPVYGFFVSLKLPPQQFYAANPSNYRKLPDSLGLIVHRGDEKAAAEDIFARPAVEGNIIFIAQGSSQVYCSPDLKPCNLSPQLRGAAAHWVRNDELLWQVDTSAERYLLLASPGGMLNQANLSEAIAEHAVYELQPKPEADPAVLKEFPHLRGFQSFTLDHEDNLASLVKFELLAIALTRTGRIMHATRVQIGGVLDQEFAYHGQLGLVFGSAPDLRLWAPTAQQVELRVYDRDKALVDTLQMNENNGVWQSDLEPEWLVRRYFYRYAMRVFHPLSGRIELYEVTDPYAVSLSTNSQFSQFVNLDDADLKPSGWDDLLRSKIKPTDISIYEVHVRDFSVADSKVPKDWRGKYLAFTQTGNSLQEPSFGMAHLKLLREAGLTHIQVLPVYDIATVNEDPKATLDLTDPFQALCTGLDFAQDYCTKYGALSIAEAFALIPKDDDTVSRLNQRLAGRDSYNWGYDPYHYGVPEGSYATNAEGEQRILEFRQMVKSLKDLGFSFAMDVVYNHTYASGLFSNSVLDRIVPGYYHRLNAVSGAVETSTCCANTASERVMMEKLMIDTLKRWVDDYQVDAFRFDLMAHHLKANLVKAKDILGPDIFLYGEGWDFGEVAQNRRGINASQLNMTGTGIGSFNDRLRDAARGGGAFDCGYLLYQQGLLNGLGFNDNGRGGLLRPVRGNADCGQRSDLVEASAAEKKSTALYLQDRIRLGLLGSLQSVSLTTAQGKAILGRELDFYGVPAAYAASPEETINYVQNHDNQTFWDINQIKLPFDLGMDERVRIHNLGLGITMLSIGIPYFEMGMEILRSKSLHRDAYNSGDWISQVDFSLTTHNWDRGLPLESEEGANVKVLQEVMMNLTDALAADHMQRSLDHFIELLQIRTSSPLFRLADAADVEKKVRFLPGSEAELGLIAMHIADDSCQDKVLDENWSEALIIFNLRSVQVSIPFERELALHPVQQVSTDQILRTARFEGGNLLIPASTMAVFVGKETKQEDSLCLNSGT